VRTSNGKEGWVLSRFLMKTQTARNRIADTENGLPNGTGAQAGYGNGPVEEEKTALSTELVDRW
jgi:hypothetical protein